MRASVQILKKFYERKKIKFPRLSIRWLAAQAGLSAPFMSRIFNNEKPLPVARVPKIGKALDMDPRAIRQLHLALLNESGYSQDAKEDFEISTEGRPKHKSKSTSESSSFDPQSIQKYWLLSEWYYLPLLELVDCEDFEADPKWISLRLGLRSEIAEQAWKRLVSAGIVTKRAEKWVKLQKNINFPSSQIDPAIQAYYISMFKKTISELSKNTPQSYQRRLIVGATVTTNEASMKRAGKFLEDALFETADILAEGDANQVCYLSVQILPLTK